MEFVFIAILGLFMYLIFEHVDDNSGGKAEAHRFRPNTED